MSAIKKTLGGFVAFGVVCTIIGAVAGTNDTATANHASTQPMTEAQVADRIKEVGAEEQAADSARKAAEPKVRLNKKGSGSGNTRQFTVTGPWQMGYAFNCGDDSGNFITQLLGPNGSPTWSAGVGANQLATKGHDVLYYSKPGTYSVQVISECNWAIKVFG